MKTYMTVYDPKNWIRIQKQAGSDLVSTKKSGTGSGSRFSKNGSETLLTSVTKLQRDDYKTHFSYHKRSFWQLTNIPIQN